MNAEYHESIEIKTLATKLQERYFPFIGYVDLDEIGSEALFKLEIDWIEKLKMDGIKLYNVHHNTENK